MGLLKLLPTDYAVTVGMCLLASLCVAILMRFFIKQGVTVLETYLYGKFDSQSKVIAIYETIKAYIYMALGAILTFIFIFKLMEVCTFPADNSKGLLLFYFIPMFALQFFFDKHMKKLACKMFGIPLSEEEDSPAKEQKAQIIKIAGKKFIKDENGSYQPYEEN